MGKNIGRVMMIPFLIVFILSLAYTGYYSGTGFAFENPCPDSGRIHEDRSSVFGNATETPGICYQEDRHPSVRYLGVIPGHPGFRTANQVNTRLVGIPVALSASSLEDFTVPVEIDDASGIAGMDIAVRFDPNILLPVEARNTLLTAGFIVMMNIPSSGEIKVSMASYSPIESGQGSMLDIIFSVLPDAKGGESTDLIIDNIALHDENARLIGGVEVSDGMFTVGDTQDNQLEQRIPLAEGWNLISFQVRKCLHEGGRPPLSLIDTNNIEFMSRGSLVGWLQDDATSPVRDETDPAIAGDWKRIISFDKDGSHLLDRDVPLFINTLHYISFGHGYWIKMNKRGYLIIKGMPASADTYLDLQPGWNLIGAVLPDVCYVKASKPQEAVCPYMPETGVYRPGEDILCYPIENMPDRLFEAVAGNYRRITAFDICSGAMLHDTQLGSDFNTLYYIGPKYGYWIKIENPAVSDQVGIRFRFPDFP